MMWEERSVIRALVAVMATTGFAVALGGATMILLPGTLSCVGAWLSKSGDNLGAIIGGIMSGALTIVGVLVAIRPSWREIRLASIDALLKLRDEALAEHATLKSIDLDPMVVDLGQVVQLTANARHDEAMRKACDVRDQLEAINRATFERTLADYGSDEINDKRKSLAESTIQANSAVKCMISLSYTEGYEGSVYDLADRARKALPAILDQRDLLIQQIEAIIVARTKTIAALMFDAGETALYRRILRSVRGALDQINRAN